MLTQFIIKFKFKGFHYEAEVKVKVFGSIKIYDVYYHLIPHSYPVEIVQIYPGSGPGERIYWRQRVDEKETFMICRELIEIIGQAILVEQQAESSR